MTPQQKNIQTPKGTRDILPQDYAFYQNIFDKAEEICSYYGFKPIQTPHLEKIELFTSTVGAATDIVEKEMYTLKTSGGDDLALRPEGTASVVRAYLEHGMQTLPQPVMLWYKGSFFRHENPQRGRFREFQQFGIEILGEAKPIGEAIIIRILTLIIDELGAGPAMVQINSIGDKECRGEYRKKLIAYYRKNEKALCDNCKKRLKTNPLRLLDCKNPWCAEIKKDAPQTLDYLCGECKSHLKEILEFLDTNEISYTLNPHLVRGLDYYSRTVFEIFIEDKNEDGEEMTPIAVAAGGRYDYLARILGKRDVPAAGAAIGVDRLALSMQEKKVAPKLKRVPKVFLIQLSQAAKQKSLKVIEMFRKASIYIAQTVNKDNLSSQLNLASKMNIPYVLILGQKECLENTIIVRDMNTGSQESVPFEQVVDVIKKKKIKK
ncbi:MAG: histidine--tRNA ligase [Candidatus Terrybacteria bacterium CG10_big_fil_rev_8_21_14_0_10_41_10]|uniref:Histidine--tRNA ligase n=1 Tax=Candidatus Terrybacteria bacterium CG10_big_fil_rev_8_21_14_0_10_41_10 TaxID=1975026 RepID=A0A2M8LA54_9BACT|nr:MAG: histidine--tRNA ligase [Candidatus Terrybacteria bacterium CG10_big_fil_rev_8_21_14_0_10_41_10]